MINSKAKGSSFERKVAGALSDWSGMEFHRTPMSGALHWSNDKRVISDIVPPQDLADWPLSIECKKVEYDWDFSTIMSGTSTFWKHWKQAEDDAEREGLKPLLIFSKNRREIYSVMRTEDHNKLFTDQLSSVIHVEKGSNKLSIILFKEFLEHTTLDKVLNFLKNFLSP